MDKKKFKPEVIRPKDMQHTMYLGVDFGVILHREKSEALEVLLERFPKGMKFRVHQHKECIQFYYILEGKANITLEGTDHTVGPGESVYIPRFTDHGIENIGDGELVYLNTEVYPDGYLPDEPTWDAHIAALEALDRKSS